MIAGKRKQVGASWAVWMIFIALIGIVGSSALRLAPTYMQYRTFRTEMKAVFEEAVTKKMSVPAIESALDRRMTMNSINIVPNDAIKIKTDPKYRIEANFEVRKKLGFNIDAVMMFNPIFEQ